MVCSRALPDITSGPEVWKIVKIRTDWKLNVFLPRPRTLITFKDEKEIKKLRKKKKKSNSSFFVVCFTYLKRSFNLINFNEPYFNQGGRLCPPKYYEPSGFSDFATALHSFIWAYSFMKFAQNNHPTLLFGPTCPNVSRTPITAMGCRQCSSLSVVQLKGKHCQKPRCRNGVVDTFRPCLFGT